MHATSKILLVTLAVGGAALVGNSVSAAQPRASHVPTATLRDPGVQRAVPDQDDITNTRFRDLSLLSDTSSVFKDHGTTNGRGLWQAGEKMTPMRRNAFLRDLAKYHCTILWLIPVMPVVCIAVAQSIAYFRTVFVIE